MRLKGLITLTGADFLRQKKFSKAYYSRNLTLLFATYREEGQGVGFILTKKVGKAVIRNKIRRRLRDIAQRSLPELGKNGFSYIFIPKSTACNCSFSELVHEVQQGLHNIGRSHRARLGVNNTVAQAT